MVNIIIADLLSETRESTTPQPHATSLSEVHDVKSWIAASMEDVHGHSTPHCFKFIKRGEEVKPCNSVLLVQLPILYLLNS